MEQKDKSPVSRPKKPPVTLSQSRINTRRRQKREAANRARQEEKKQRLTVAARYKKIPLHFRPVMVGLADKGMSYSQIAALLNNAYNIQVSRNTVKYHIQRFRKLTGQVHAK